MGSWVPGIICRYYHWFLSAACFVQCFGFKCPVIHERLFQWLINFDPSLYWARVTLNQWFIQHCFIEQVTKSCINSLSAGYQMHRFEDSLHRHLGSRINCMTNEESVFECFGVSGSLIRCFTYAWSLISLAHSDIVSLIHWFKFIGLMNQ